MTFYELEKKCKKKKFTRITGLFFILAIFIVFIVFLSYRMPKFVKSESNEKNISKRISQDNIKKHKKQPKATKQFKEIIILPSIDLNITNKNTEKNKSSNNINIKHKLKSKTQNTKAEISGHNKVIIKAENIPSFKTCISIAEKYLQMKDYQNALKWAKYANIQNKKDPISWIISAKALYFSGKKQEAVKLLKIYDSYYNNKEIKNLIKEWGDK